MDALRIANVQRYLANERAAGRFIFELTDNQIAALLAAADGQLHPASQAKSHLEEHSRLGMRVSGGAGN